MKCVSWSLRGKYFVGTARLFVDCAHIAGDIPTCVLMARLFVECAHIAGDVPTCVYMARLFLACVHVAGYVPTCVYIARVFARVDWSTPPIFGRFFWFSSLWEPCFQHHSHSNANRAETLCPHSLSECNNSFTIIIHVPVMYWLDIRRRMQRDVTSSIVRQPCLRIPNIFDVICVIWNWIEQDGLNDGKLHCGIAHNMFNYAARLCPGGLITPPFFLAGRFVWSTPCGYRASSITRIQLQIDRRHYVNIRCLSATIRSQLLYMYRFMYWFGIRRRMQRDVIRIVNCTIPWIDRNLNA